MPEAPGWLSTVIGPEEAQGLTDALASAGPYFTAVGAAFSIYSAISSSGWQRATTDQLNRIEAAINDLTQKVEGLSKQVSALPAIFQQITEDEYLNEVNGIVSGYGLLINSYINRPSGGLNADDKRTLHDAADALIVHAGSLDSYGTSAYPIVALAISYFLVAATAAQDQYDRSTIVNFINDRISYFNKNANSLQDTHDKYNYTALQNWRYVINFPHLVYMGVWDVYFSISEIGTQLISVGSPHDPSLGLLAEIPVPGPGYTPLPHNLNGAAVYLDLSRYNSIDSDFNLSDATLIQITLVDRVLGPTNGGFVPALNPRGAPPEPGYTFPPLRALPTYRDRVVGILGSFETANSVFHPAVNAATLALQHVTAIRGGTSGGASVAGIITSLQPWTI